MNESLHTPSGKSGLPPGALVHVGDILETVTSMSVIDYSKDSFAEHKIHSIDELSKYRESASVTWVIVEGLANVEIVEQIGSIFGIHRLVLEDILNTNQRPKFEEYDDYLYIVLKCLILEDEQFTVSYEQVSILVLSNFVFLFKEKKDALFSSIQQRIEKSKGRLRSQGTDYLTYMILDYIVDQNFILIDSLDDVVTSLEDQLLDSEPTQDLLHKIQRVRRKIVDIRVYISPVRELLAGMLRSESELINESTRIYLRDVSDHTIRVIELIESYREILTGLLDIYVSSVSNKMNEVMKVLTVFASIFIPLTFLTGIYGMNFDTMPELQWQWAYPFLWVVFITLPVGLITYFKRKKWL
ncbi:MAG: magnesium/cobalt transporter CorA [Gammaproteobacteria bacterium]